MRGIGWMGALALGMAGPAVARGDAPPQAALDQLAAGLDYRFEVVDNRPTCPQGMANCFLATITLTLPEKLPPSLRKGADLSLYFSFVNPLDRIESDLFDYRNINGDVQQLTLKPGAVLRPGARHVIKLWGVGSHFSRAVVMPNAYLVAKGREARVIAATRDAIDP
ncbi:MAG: carbohydate-binding domain-containing protein, partial [Sphingomonas sp.]